MKSVLYRGYRILPRPMQLRDSNQWTLNVSIHRDTHGEVHVQGFSGKNTFATRDEAERMCVRFGQDIIDGKVPRCDVSDL